MEQPPDGGVWSAEGVRIISSEAFATWFARLGLASRGLVYVLVGWFAADAALRGGRTADTNGAIASLADKPFGWILLSIVACGLIGYALWRSSEAATALTARSSGAKAGVKVAGLVFSAIVHAALAWTALKLATGAAATRDSSPNDESARDWTAWTLSQPMGQAFVAAVAICFVFGAGDQFRKAWTGDFVEELEETRSFPSYFCTIGRVGFTARGIVFGILAFFFARAAWRAQASEAGGMADALASLQAQPGGVALLLATGLGLSLFGAYSLIEARFRRVRVKIPA